MNLAYSKPDLGVQNPTASNGLQAVLANTNLVRHSKMWKLFKTF